jgi:hypothetical protein
VSRLSSGAAGRFDTVARLAAGVVLSTAIMSACTEEPLGNLDSGSAPGASSVTRELVLSVTDLSTWRDTTVTGFAVPSNAPFLILAEQQELRARGLSQLDIPDTLNTFADTLPVDHFVDASMRLVLDTVNSVFGSFPLTVRMVSLAQEFVPAEASWTEAEEGRPWITPGADLAEELSSVQMTEVSDSLIFEFQVPVDSLLKSWQDLDGQPGFALVLEGPGSRLLVRALSLRIEAVLEGREAPIEQTLINDVRTFISDPEPPSPGQDLRLGGVPASRFYLEFSPPDSVGGFPLHGSTINHAELIFHPLPPPAEPYAMERGVVALPVKLMTDPFIWGAKTPIGSSLGGFAIMDPDSLAAGIPLRVDVRSLLISALSGPADSIGTIRVGMRSDPDGQSLGYWEFGSVQSSAAYRPELLIIFTTPPEFGVP